MMDKAHYSRENVMDYSDRCTATAEYIWTGDVQPSPFHCEQFAGHLGEHHQLTLGGSFSWPNVFRDVA